MDLSKLSLKTDFDVQNTLNLKDINGITGIIDSTVTGADSLTGLLFPSSESAQIDYDISRYDDNGGAYPQIQQRPEKFAFLFDIKEDYKLHLQSDITDHWTEENFVVNDHIANKPVEIELTGKVSEVRINEYWRSQKSEDGKVKGKGLSSGIENAISNYADKAAEKAGALTQFAPNIVNQAIQLKNAAKMAYTTVNKAKQYVNKLKSIGNGDTPSNKNNTINRRDVMKFDKKNNGKYELGRQFGFVRQWFFNWWQSKIPFTLITPFGTFYNMFILDFNATQNKDTVYITDISIKFKQLNIATTKKEKKKEAEKTKTQKNKPSIVINEGDISKALEPKYNIFPELDQTSSSTNLDKEVITTINVSPDTVSNANMIRNNKAFLSEA